MFQTYEQIYNQRGELYHRAMEQWPNARKRELGKLVETAAIPRASPKVVDVPSGGGYLRRYLPEDAQLISVDPASSFLEAGQHDEEISTICSPHDAIPLPDESVDAVLSLAGLHHVEDKAAAFREWYRLLKPGGVLTVGDVESGSPVQAFLDTVMGEFNSMGHSGTYLTYEHPAMLERLGCHITCAEVKACTWGFADRSGMLEFCRTLFGMDRMPSDEALLAGIERTVGHRETDGGCEMNWALYYIRAVKPMRRGT